MILNSGADIVGIPASRILRNEHRVIERGLQAAETMVNAQVLRKDHWDKLLAFFKNFVENFHHTKEEDELFSILKSAPSADLRSSVERVLEEHEKGRTLLNVVEAKLGPALRGEQQAAKALRRATHKYISLLRQHIRQEDQSLLAMADEVLGPEEQVLMAAALDWADQTGGHEGQRDRYVALVDELCRQTRVAETEYAQTIL